MYSIKSWIKAILLILVVAITIKLSPGLFQKDDGCLDSFVLTEPSLIALDVIEELGIPESVIIGYGYVYSDNQINFFLATTMGQLVLPLCATGTPGNPNIKAITD